MSINHICSYSSYPPSIVSIEYKEFKHPFSLLSSKYPTCTITHASYLPYLLHRSHPFDNISLPVFLRNHPLSISCSAPLFGRRILPVGTLYDPFIARGLDALNYACYQESRFLLVGTPSGLSLAPEGGAHQSINTPLIGT